MGYDACWIMAVALLLFPNAYGIEQSSMLPPVSCIEQSSMLPPFLSIEQASELPPTFGIDQNMMLPPDSSVKHSSVFPQVSNIKNTGGSIGRNLTLHLIPIESAYGNHTFSTSSVTLPAEGETRAFYVRITIGTGIAAKEKRLIFDTGSSLTWVQCVPCNPCTSRAEDLFDSALSNTYVPILDSDPLCQDPFIRNQDLGRCTYNINYGNSNSVSTTGQLAKELFLFNNALVTTPSMSFGSQLLVFGCSNTAQVPPNLDGILGMGYRAESFSMQLLEYTSSDTFSYCLSRTGQSSITIGGDFELLEGQETPLLKYNDNANKYFLVLEDVGFNGERMGFGEERFGRYENGEKGGCFIDTGCTYSRLNRDVYEQLREKLVKYFRDKGLEQNDRDGNLCYNVDGLVITLPMFTYFLRGAELTIRGESVFKRRNHNRKICWTVFPNDMDKNVIGMYTQIDTRFVFNVAKKTLAFGPEVCGS